MNKPVTPGNFEATSITKYGSKYLSLVMYYNAVNSFNFDFSMLHINNFISDQYTLTLAIIGSQSLYLA